MNVNAPPKTRMKVSEFLAWGETQPQGRYELAGGEIIAMSPERVRHNLVKFAVARALEDAVKAAHVSCTVFTDGVAIVIDEETAREPDASVQWGFPADLDSMINEAPVIVVEVSSPSSGRTDAERKLVEYFSVPGIRHYLIVLPEQRTIIHHQKNEAGEIATRIMREGQIDMTPPGITVEVAALLGPPLSAPGATQ